MQRVQRGLEQSRRRYARRAGRGGKRLADDSSKDDLDWGGGAHTLFAPSVIDRDGRRRWVLEVEAHSCAFGMRLPWKPWGFLSPDFPEELRECPIPPSSVALEIFVRVSFPTDMHEA